MSYLNYMTVVSLHKHNPDYEIRVYTPAVKSKISNTWASPEQKVKYVGKDYWPIVQDLDYVKVRKVDFSKVNIPNDISEIHRSDFLRYILLGDTGGIWSDFDILYLKPLDDINLCWCQSTKDETDTVLSFDGRHFIIGFFMASQDNEFFKTIFAKAVANFKGSGYQSIGCSLLMGLFRNMDDVAQKFPKLKFGNLDKQSLYPIFYESMHLLFDNQHKQEGLKLLHPTNTIGIHWYNGHSSAKDFCNRYNPEKPIDCLITDLIKWMEI